VGLTPFNSALWTCQSYDFKGNVTSRPPLTGGPAFTYTWDAFDRLKSAARSGMTTVNTTYDAGGRLLKRTQGSEKTTNYWLGLNKIAEERWGDEAGADDPVFRPSAEAHGDNLDNEPSAEPETDGWGFYQDTGNGDAEYKTDSERGRVLHLSTTDSGDLDGKFIVGDFPYAETRNPNDVAFEDTIRRHLGLWVKNENTGNPYEIWVMIITDVRARQIIFKTATGTDAMDGANNPRYHIGTSYNDGEWHYLEFDLDPWLNVLLPSETILTVNAVRLFGKDLYVDDITLSGGALEKSYALIPGAAIGGYLGVQSGEAGGDAGASTPAWSRWHHHYNDLGTVIAATDEDGAKIGVYTPDFWGNYHAGVETQSQLAALYESLDADDETIADLLRANALLLDLDPRPDSMGLTSKFFDEDAELYYFTARWFDPSRGSWLSEDPSRLNGPNRYLFNLASPVDRIDADGELSWAVWGLIGGTIIAAWLSWPDIREARYYYAEMVHLTFRFLDACGHISPALRAQVWADNELRALDINVVRFDPSYAFEECPDEHCIYAIENLAGFMGDRVNLTEIAEAGAIPGTSGLPMLIWNAIAPVINRIL
jgi:RHS repeat-associated protein